MPSRLFINFSVFSTSDIIDIITGVASSYAFAQVSDFSVNLTASSKKSIISCSFSRLSVYIIRTCVSAIYALYLFLPFLFLTIKSTPNEYSSIRSTIQGFLLFLFLLISLTKNSNILSSVYVPLINAFHEINNRPPIKINAVAIIYYHSSFLFSFASITTYTFLLMSRIHFYQAYSDIQGLEKASE